jgi:hypothetical protein
LVLRKLEHLKSAEERLKGKMASENQKERKKERESERGGETKGRKREGERETENERNTVSSGKHFSTAITSGVMSTLMESRRIPYRSCASSRCSSLLTRPMAAQRCQGRNNMIEHHTSPGNDRHVRAPPPCSRGPILRCFLGSGGSRLLEELAFVLLLRSIESTVKGKHEFKEFEVRWGECDTF